MLCYNITKNDHAFLIMHSFDRRAKPCGSISQQRFHVNTMFKQLFIPGVIGIALTGAASAATLTVVTSFSILDDFAREVSGDRITVQSIVPGNGAVNAYYSQP